MLSSPSPSFTNGTWKTELAQPETFWRSLAPNVLDLPPVSMLSDAHEDFQCLIKTNQKHGTSGKPTAQWSGSKKSGSLSIRVSQPHVVAKALIAPCVAAWATSCGCHKVSVSEHSVFLHKTSVHILAEYHFTSFSLLNNLLWLWCHLISQKHSPKIPGYAKVFVWQSSFTENPTQQLAMSASVHCASSFLDGNSTRIKSKKNFEKTHPNRVLGIHNPRIFPKPALSHELSLFSAPAWIPVHRIVASTFECGIQTIRAHEIHERLHLWSIVIAGTYIGKVSSTDRQKHIEYSTV